MFNQKRRLLASCLAVLWLGLPAYGQKFWEKKSYDQWSETEAAQMFVDSPWGLIQRSASDSQALNVRLHSALPIRQALVRLRQIRLSREKLTPAEQAKIDSEVQEFLACAECEKYYIVTLRPLSNDKKIMTALASLSFDELKPYVSLSNDTGASRRLVKFLPPTSGGEMPLFVGNAMFFFPRFDDQGKPLLGPDNKDFYFTIDKKALKGTDVVLKKVTFQVSRITIGGRILF